MVYDDHESEEEEDESVVSEEEEEEGDPGKRDSEEEEEAAAAAPMEGDDDDSDYPEEMEDEDDASYCTESSFRSHSTYSSTPGRPREAGSARWRLLRRAGEGSLAPVSLRLGRGARGIGRKEGNACRGESGVCGRGEEEEEVGAE